MNAETMGEWLVGNAPPVLRRDFPHRADLCVLASRIGFDVCNYFGVEAKPVVVRTLAYNSKWREFVAAHPQLLDDLDQEAWEKASADGAYSVAIDEQPRNEKGRFAGHLVLYLPDSAQLLDLTLRQFARPEHDMHFPDAAAFNCDSDFMDGEPHSYSTDEGAEIIYRRRADMPQYRNGGDWRLHNPLSGELIRKAKAELGVAA